MRIAATAATLGCALLARADVVTDWNEKAVAAAYMPYTNAGAAAGPGTLGVRMVTMATIAMYEAVNSIDKRYTPYRSLLPADPSWPKEVAASAAARAVLAKLAHADKQAEMTAMHQAVLARYPDGDAKARAIALGEQAAAAILAERENDGSNTANDWRPVTAPGQYVVTQFPIAINWAKAKPFGLARPDQFRAPPPMALGSPAWARDYNEVKRMGAKAGSARTEEQTKIAKFWEMTGPGTYNPMGVQLVAANKFDLTDCARAMALLSIATHDAGIAVFDSKYTYNFWRPVTAIRNGDTDGNDATDRDDKWEPFINTPMHPEYPCAHCTIQSATASVLQTVYGNDIAEVKLTSVTAPGVTRTFRKLSDYVDEVIEARIYDGVHYRFSGEAGRDVGRQVGQYVAANYFKPLR
ncbi:MAG TPA: vanadium-dependent haloperoxidase [Usitatibacter sp.]|nr:vanadium-dependent haloperoxidase [Usitatibacter sp.]